MEARSLFAMLAILFLLWMIRKWFMWDMQEQWAQESRGRLRSRIAVATLSERIRPPLYVEEKARLASNVLGTVTTDGHAGGGVNDELPITEKVTDSIKFAQLEKTNAVLKSELHDARLELQRLEHAMEENSKLNKVLFEKQRQIDQQQQFINQLETTAAQYRDKAQRVAMLEQQLSEVKSVVEAQESQINVLTSDLRQSRQQTKRLLDTPSLASRGPVVLDSEEADSNDEKRLRLRLSRALAASQLRAREAGENDLEYRRLLSELESIPDNKGNSIARLIAFKERLATEQHIHVEAVSDSLAADEVLEGLTPTQG